MKLSWVVIGLCVFAAVGLAQDTAAMLKKCSLTVSWSRRGEDASVTVAVKNGTKKTLVDPVVRVRFYNKDSVEVASDAKMYFNRIKAGATKRMETRIWSLIPHDASYTQGSLDAGVFE